MQKKRKFVRKINFKLNNNIRFKKLLVIDEEGKNHGILELDIALQLAKSKGLDLLLVSNSDSKPVARILNYGKYQYKIKKKRKKTKTRQVREVKFKITTDTHDLNVKIAKIKKFLLDNDMVKVSIRFRGREVTRKSLGFELMKNIFAQLSDIAIMEKKPTQNNMLLDMYLVKKKVIVNEN